MTDTDQDAEVRVMPKEKPSAPLPEGVTPDTPFSGELLRRLRQSRNIPLEDIAARTRIGLKSLTAIEEERFEDLPNARVFIYGFVRCLAKELNLDMDQVSRSYLPRWDNWNTSKE